MRIQILELPTVVVGDDVTTPFALIFDRCPMQALTGEPLGAREFAVSMGAAGYFCTPETVEIVDQFSVADVDEVRAVGAPIVRISHSSLGPALPEDIIARLEKR